MPIRHIRFVKRHGQGVVIGDSRAADCNDFWVQIIFKNVLLIQYVIGQAVTRINIREEFGEVDVIAIAAPVQRCTIFFTENGYRVGTVGRIEGRASIVLIGWVIDDNLNRSSITVLESVERTDFYAVVVIWLL